MQTAGKTIISLSAVAVTLAALSPAVFAHLPASQVDASATHATAEATDVDDDPTRVDIHPSAETHSTVGQRAGFSTAQSATSRTSTSDPQRRDDSSHKGKRGGAARSASSDDRQATTTTVKSKPSKGKGSTSKPSNGKDSTSKHTRVDKAAKYSGTFVANFVFALSTPNENAAMIRDMKADAITFGYRVRPASARDYPASVRKAIGKKRVFAYSNGFVAKSSKVVNGYAITPAGGAVVVSKATGDKQKALLEGAQKVGAGVYVGLPAPVTQGYLVNTSYLNVMYDFTRTFVKTYPTAHGFYHHSEMPVSHGRVWEPVLKLYSTQNKAVASVRPGARTLVAPYIETRSKKPNSNMGGIAAGTRRILATAKGTSLIIAPQDGIGVGSGTLTRNGGHTGTTQQVFRIMRGVAGKRLYVVTEAMRPGGGQDTRARTTAPAVKKQLDALAPYTQGSIGFMWNNATGMKSIPGITKYSAGTGRLP